MATRRRTEPEAAHGPVLPDELAHCIIEQWTVPEDAVGVVPYRPDLDGPLARSFIAWRRWQAARRAWCAANGIDPKTLPGGRPRW